jgi:hypothetical protein
MGQMAEREPKMENEIPQIHAVIDGFPEHGTAARMGTIADEAAIIMRDCGLTSAEKPEANARQLIQTHSSDVRVGPKGPDIFQRIWYRGRPLWMLRYPKERCHELVEAEDQKR